MTFSESLAYLAFLVQVAANVAVAFVVFPMWRQRRLHFFLILGFSALLGVFTTVVNWIWGERPMLEADYYRFWCAMQILSIVDLACYAVGIALMVRRFRSRPAVSSTPPSP